MRYCATLVGIAALITACGDDGPGSMSGFSASASASTPMSATNDLTTSTGGEPTTGATQATTTADATGSGGDGTTTSTSVASADPTTGPDPVSASSTTETATTDGSTGPAPACGDGMVDPGETCDDGAENGPGKACKADCTPNVCGDGDLGPGEGCDDGNVVPGDACSPTCQSEGCGNNNVDPMEGCDDGKNGNNDDGCTDLCQPPKCGDGFSQASLMETCDAGAMNSDAGMCTTKCKTAACGDGLVFVGMEACDAGAANSDAGMCTKACKLAACGDGLVWMGMETCDDGNVKDGDGCSAACKVEMMTKCGNGVIDQGERCDTKLAPPFTGVGCKPQTCFYDFSQVPQLYCNGGCTWAGNNDCDQPDADIYCKLKTGNPNSTAMSFQVVTALDTFGFACPFLGTSLGPLPEFGVNLDVKYQGTSILANHGPGNVVANAVCTNP